VAVACSSVLLMTGLTFGVGWVMAGSDFSEGGPNSRGGSVLQDGTSPATQPNPANPQQPKPQDRAQALGKSADEIAKRIDQLQDQLLMVRADSDMVGVSVLQSELFALDKQILETEKQSRAHQQSLEHAVKVRESVVKQELIGESLRRRIEQSAPVKEAASRVAKAKATATSLQQKLGADHPIMLAATKETADAEVALKEAREKGGPEAERQIRSEIAKEYDNNVADQKATIKSYSTTLVELHDDRRKLVIRIAEVDRAEAKRQALQDELRVYREIQLELLRQRTLAELGLDVQSVAPRPASDPKVEAQIRDLKREIEVLRGEVEKLSKKN